jgi:hypothetical protein
MNREVGAGNPQDAPHQDAVVTSPENSVRAMKPQTLIKNSFLFTLFLDG